jgi:hypothetical protein
MNPGACILDAFGQLFAGIVGEGSPDKNRGRSTGYDMRCILQKLNKTLAILQRKNLNSH